MWLSVVSSFTFFCALLLTPNYCLGHDDVHHRHLRHAITRHPTAKPTFAPRTSRRHKTLPPAQMHHVPAPIRPTTARPTNKPTAPPTSQPTTPPTSQPTAPPTVPPTARPTPPPTEPPTNQPTTFPTTNQSTPPPTVTANQPPPPPPLDNQPTPTPTVAPTTANPASNVVDMATQWTIAHNTRRTEFYATQNLTAKDLTWNDTIAASAQAYADSLLELDGCQYMHNYKNDHFGGEILALNAGYDASFTPDQLLQMWYEERDLAFPYNLRFSQVIWRGTSQFGCGISSKPYFGNKGCFIQVCRYIAPGNCNVDKTNLLSKALEEYSPC